MKIAIGNDHVGIELKPVIVAYLQDLGHDVDDFGAFSNERTDYPEYGKKLQKV